MKDQMQPPPTLFPSSSPSAAHPMSSLLSAPPSQPSQASTKSSKAAPLPSSSPAGASTAVSADPNPAADSSLPSLSRSVAKSVLDPPSSVPKPNLSATVAAPAKIPSRPRKTRKLAVSTVASQGEPKLEVDGGGTLVAVPPEVGSSRTPRIAYRVLPRPLSAEGEVAAAIRRLRAADLQLARVIEAHEVPVFQSLHPPFHSLTRSILYQQLAFKAAASIYSRFLALCGGEAGVVPEVVLSLTPHQLRQIGVSARKASYLHDLANKYRSGILSDASIVAMDDKSLFTMLTMVKGIGAWSVHMFMIFSLHRPDVLPVGDLGVRKGVQLLYGLDALPRPSQMEQLCERWKPYRSVGSWYMWRLVEAKGAPTALTTVSSIGTVAAGGDGVYGYPMIGGIPPPLSPLPSQHQPLQRQTQPQQHMHQQHQHPQQHPRHQHQHQHQQQLQIQSQLVDAIQSIPNLG